MARRHYSLFWNEACKDLSVKLWWPTETELTSSKSLSLPWKLPKLGVARMVKKVLYDQKTNQRKRRKLSSRSCRDVLTLGHGKFFSRLQQKCHEYTNRTVKEVGEAWTSKTCGCCGMINQHLGSNESFKCVNLLCDKSTKSTDRDLHSARNIYLRSLVMQA